MSFSNTLFDRMDAWRHLPSYQLERRADLFFSLYIPEVLQAKLGFPVSDQLIPEFPIRKGTIDEKRPKFEHNQSFKVDYLAFSSNFDTAILIELKTDDSSRRSDQDKYLLQAQEKPFPELLMGVLQLFKATSAKPKYLALLRLLAAAEQIQSTNQDCSQVTITTQVTQCLKVYIQPNGTGHEIINFHDFVKTVELYTDPVSQRFAQSLYQWSTIKAGLAK